MSAAINLHSPAFAAGACIPRKHTADGSNLSPPLQWTGVPSTAKELALIVDDPDAPREMPWVHWVAYRIAPATVALPEGVPPAERVAQPASMLQGVNSWGRIGYGGPEPPRGHGVHHYRFRIYALDDTLDRKPGSTREALLAAMEGHVLATGELVGTYER